MVVWRTPNIQNRFNEGGLARIVEAGIDEAGRGPVLGPLVVAGVATVDPAYLTEIGCRDSKTLSAPQRERLARLIENDPDVRTAVRIVDAEVLDRERTQATLNAIERQRFIEVAAELDAPRVIVDAADTNAERFGNEVAAALPDDWEVISEHQADGHHATVAAASIIAKVTRDRAIEDLGKRLERAINRPIGSGYPSDPKTRAFLQEWLRVHGDLPEGTRRSWKTAQELLAPRARSLDEFGSS